jgi:hypothetical protein
MGKIENAKPMDWFNTETNTQFYGVKVKVDGEWRPLAIDNEPFFVDTFKKAQVKCRELLGFAV